MTPTARFGLVRRAGAEAIGTFALVFAGCGAIMVNTLTDGLVGHGGVAAAFGLAIGVMVYATGHISGAHFNPAVSLGFASMGQFAWREVPAYILAQCAAAIGAAVLLRALLGPVASIGTTIPAGSAGQSIALEVVLTFFLMFVIAAVATDDRAPGRTAGLAIGGTVALGAIVGGPISGGSMNPARSLGPALVSGDLSQFWIYVVGPVAGALLGAASYRLVR